MDVLIERFVARAALGPNERPEEVMDRLVKKLRHRGRAVSPDARLYAALRSRRIDVDESRHVTRHDGMLEPKGVSYEAGFVISLNSQLSAVRRRFTLAHEMCHSFFYEYVPELKFCPHDTSDEEERLCDQGAAAFLMPESAIRMSVPKGRANFEVLDELCATYGVSASAMMLRLLALKLWKCELSEWHRMADGSFVIDRVYGGALRAWQWNDPSLVHSAWGGNKTKYGHTVVWFSDENGSSFYRPVHFGMRRMGERLWVLWGKDVTQNPRSYPLFGRGA